ncbi:MAG: GtrA family protein [Elusimicrobiota bacterium]
MTDLKSILRQFSQRESTPLVQFIKYSLGGVVATTVDVVVFYILAIWILPALTPSDPIARVLGLRIAALAEGARSTRYVLDRVITFMFSNYTAYYINIRWVFTPGRHSKAIEVALFYAVSIASFCLGTGLGWLLIRATGMDTTYAYAANVVASVAINYVCRKYVVFKG